MMKKKNPILLFLFFENKVIQLAQLTRKRILKLLRVGLVSSGQLLMLLSFEILF